MVNTNSDVILNSLTINGITRSLYIDDPNFIDRNNRDYHLTRGNSSAIDRCGDSNITTPLRDIDFSVRGIDDVNITNVGVTYDIGADEVVGNDIIFKNGFE